MSSTRQKFLLHLFILLFFGFSTKAQLTLPRQPYIIEFLFKCNIDGYYTRPLPRRWRFKDYSLLITFAASPNSASIIRPVWNTINSIKGKASLLALVDTDPISLPLNIVYNGQNQTLRLESDSKDFTLTIHTDVDNNGYIGLYVAEVRSMVKDMNLDDSVYCSLQENLPQSISKPNFD